VRKVPLRTSSADDPEPALRRIEREPSSDREAGDVIVRAEAVLAEDAAGVHRGARAVEGVA